MAVKSDRWIRRMARERGLIEPFVEAQKREGVISFGLSSYGYDMRVGTRFKVSRPGGSGVMDPKQPAAGVFEDVHTDTFLEIPPHAIALGQSVEYFRIPRNVVTAAFGKSTYARCGLVVNITPFEPEWEGFVTLEMSNTTPFPLRVYANEGIAQILFFESDEVCEVSYADRKGKYQGQTAITLGKI